MSELKVEDFKDLNVSPFAEKVSKIEDLSFLDKLEVYEKETKDRVGVLDAINQRQGELYEANVGAELVKEDRSDFPANVVVGDMGVTGFQGEGVVGATMEGVEDGGLVYTGDGPVGDLDYQTEKEKLQTEDDKEEEYTKEESKTEKIKILRLELDLILQYAQGHFRVHENVDAPIFKAKAWLGKFLSFEGDRKNPYDVGKVETASAIPATAEKHDGTEFVIARRDFGNKNVLDAIQELRTKLDRTAEGLQDVEGESRLAKICLTQAWVNVCEAKFELGQQLSKLRIQ